MRNRKNLLLIAASIAAIVAGWHSPARLYGADGSWNVDANGNWSEASNWLDSIVADGVDATANFTNPLSQSRSVTLDSSRTIGNLNFSRTGTALASWGIYQSSTQSLTLARTSGMPTIHAEASSGATIDAWISGSDGLRKTGEGSLRLRGGNTYSGGTVLSAGSLTIEGDSSLGNPAEPITFDGNGSKTLVVSPVQGATLFVRPVTLHAGGTNILMGTGTWSGAWSGDGSLTIHQADTITFTGKNTYSGATLLSGGQFSPSVLRAIDGVGLSPFSNLTFANGELQTMGTFSRSTGNGPGEVQWTSAGVLVPYGGSLRVRLNGGAGTVQVGVDGFLPVGVPFYLGNPRTSDGLLDFQNGIDMAGSTLTVFAADNSRSATDRYRISGSIANGSLLKGQWGTLVLTGENSYANTGFVDNGGTLQIGDGRTSGTLGTGTVDLTGGTLLFNRSDALVVTNTIIGMGRLAQEGIGSTVLQGDASNHTSHTDVRRGTLVLDYTNETIANPSKLSNTQSLSIGSATLQLDGGTYPEVVGWTTIRGAATIGRVSGSSTLVLNSITRESGGSLELAFDNLATTDLLNVNGVLPGVTVAGNLAKNGTNSVDGQIVALSSADYTDVQRAGGSLADGSAQVRIVTGGPGGVIAPVSSGTTTINTLTQSAADGPAVVELGVGNRLRMGAVGTILIPSGGADLTIAGGSLTAGGADGVEGELLFNNSASSVITVTSTIADNGNSDVGLTKSGLGTLVLSPGNTYTRSTYLTGGVTIISDESCLGDAAGAFVNISLLLDGGTLRTTNSFAIDDNRRDITIGSAGGRIETDAGTTLTITQRLSGETELSPFTKSGTGRLVLTAAADYGPLNVENGVLQIGNGGSTGTLGGGEVTLAGGTELVFNRAGILPVHVEIAGDGSVTQAGPGTTILGGFNTYTGSTTISAGKLLVNGSVSGSAVTVGAGALLGGIGEIDGPITIESGGLLAPGASIGQMSIGNLALTAGSVFNPEIDLGLAADLLNVTGQISLGDSLLELTFLNPPASNALPLTFLLIDNDQADGVMGEFASINVPSGFLASVDYAYAGTDALGRVGDGNDLAVTITAVPEPTAFLLAICALLVLPVLRNQRSR
jgi:fibronectin-binding autotransporter adhesin